MAKSVADYKKEIVRQRDEIFTHFMQMDCVKGVR